MKTARLIEKSSSDIALRNGSIINKEALANFLGSYLFFRLNGNIGFGYCSGVSLFMHRNDSTIKIDIPHLHTYIEKRISDFEWLESISISEIFSEEIQKTVFN